MMGSVVHGSCLCGGVRFEVRPPFIRASGLLGTGTPDLAERRRAFAAEVRDAIRRVDAISALVAARHAGLID